MLGNKGKLRVLQQWNDEPKFPATTLKEAPLVYHTKKHQTILEDEITKKKK